MDADRWRTVLEAFRTARELPATERRAYAQTAVTDPEALAELLAILAREDTGEGSGGSLFATAGGAAATAAGAAPGQEWARLGQTFGRFVVDSPLGRGGMGEVYRARDTELNRTVALKFLSSGDIGSPESVTRFLREAHAASALNHPGIVTVFDVVRDGSAVGIVMELIEGVSLRGVCGRPHPAAQVADWGRQVALALMAAHAAGIVHRDIKPENLMLRPDGFVKVLDFGLARRLQGSLLQSGTAQFAGTLRYMSPEQVRGEVPGPSSDIFTLGIVLYELATGVHPFGSEASLPEEGKPQGRTSSPPEFDALLAPYLITTRETRPAVEIEPSIPAELDALLTAMLQKDVSKRPNAGIVADRLLAIPQSSGGTRKTRRRRMTKPSVRRAAVAGLALCAAVGGAILWAPRREPVERAVPAIVEGLPLTGAPGNETNPAFSPDGRQIAYAWDGGSPPEEQSIYVRLVEGGNPLRLTHGAQDDSPVWSPDASKVAFLRYSAAGAQVMVVPALGGAQRAVATIPDSRLNRHKILAWSPDADELIAADSAGGSGPNPQLSLYGIRISSGQKRRLTDPPEGTDDMDPVFSPDGSKLAFLRRHGTAFQLHVIDRLGGPARGLASEYVEGLAWSQDGRSLIFCTNASPPRRVQVVSAAGGRPSPAPFQFGSVMRDLVVSPGGGRMAFVHEQKDRNIWALDKGSSAFRPLIASTRSDVDPRISPDGRKIAFTSNRAGAYEVWVCERDGANPHPVTSLNTFAGSPAWSPDGKTLAFDASVNGPTMVWLVNAEGGSTRRLMNPPAPGYIPNWSADGEWMYYVGKGLQIWKTKVSGGPAVQVTHQGGFEGFETFDGRYFYFVRAVTATGIWRLPVAGGEEELLPELASVQPFRSWDMAKDGIYYVESSPKPVLKLFRFRDRKTLVVAPVAQPPQKSERGLAVSPDGSLILYMQVDSIRNEILMTQTPP
jgi:Tol biopolymer transport system component